MKFQNQFITFLIILINFIYINDTHAQQESTGTQEQSLISPESQQEQEIIDYIENDIASVITQEQQQEDSSELDEISKEAQELIARFPFMVSLRNYNNYHYCAGVLVSKYTGNYKYHNLN